MLLVDDDESTRFLHRRNLRKARADARFLEAADGQAALDALRSLAAAGENPPRLILLDVQMPRLDGWSFLAAYARHFPPERRAATRVYVTTNSVDPEAHERGDRDPEVAGMVDKLLDSAWCREVLGLASAAD